MNNKKRIIEVAFPVEEVSAQGRRDKNKQQITGIHIWWASRPLGPSRATAYAALVDNFVGSIKNKNCVPDSNDTPRPSKHEFISEFSKWENALSPLWINQAREDILASNDGIPPKVLDPFGGRGAIPLEAQRLSCKTYSSDLNPVSVLIQKCTVEYPQRYGKRLQDDVKKLGVQIINQVTEELAQFYLDKSDSFNVFAFIWARTLPCQNIHCSTEIPLVNKFWLAKNKKIALFPYEVEKQVAFRIVGPGYEPIPTGFDPDMGTITKAIVTCPICKSMIPAARTRYLFQEEVTTDERMIVVVTHRQNVTGKRYRLATNEDVAIFNHAQKRLAEKQEFLKKKWGFDPVPDEPTPKIKGPGAERALSIHNYNLNTYGALFNARQKLALITFTEKIRDTYSEMIAQENYSLDYAQAVSTCLGLWLDRIADMGSNLCLWGNSAESVVKLFGMQTLPMVWDYGEANLLRVAANRLKTFLKPMEHLCQMVGEPVTVKQASATNLQEHYPDEFFDAVLTDPPYYDNVPYSYLSDFFYVWLKRSVGKLYPELFKTELTPKDDEVVAYGHHEGGLKTGRKLFEKGLSKAFKEAHRVLKPNGIAVIVYAHKSTEGWETLINALLDSNLVITGVWPIDTEKKVRWRSYNSAALASSIYMVARKTEREAFGVYQDIKRELEVQLKQKLFTLWEWGFSGADLFIAAIGLGIEVFGKYETVIDDDDNLVRANRMIADIREILERFDRDQVGIASTQLTRFYLRWRRQYGDEHVPFDKAKKLALSLGIELTEQWGENSFIQQEKTNVRVLGPHKRELTDVSDSVELIDTLHHALLLWSSGNREEMIQCLSIEDIGLNELIWNVAQQIRDALSADSQERQWLEGWLADRETIQREIGETQENLLRETLF